MGQLRTALVGLTATAVLLAGAAHGQCRTDFDQSGAVEINELIQAVNEALGGCDGPVPTPTAPATTCPYQFNDAVGSDRYCGYDGSIGSPVCSPLGAVSAWGTDDLAVLVVFTDGEGLTVALEGRRTNPTTARVSALSFGPDFDESFEATGTMSLPSNRRLMVTFNAGGSCGTITLAGDFYGLEGTNAQTSAPSLGALRKSLAGRGVSDPTPEYVERLRALQHRLAQ